MERLRIDGDAAWRFVLAELHCHEFAPRQRSEKSHRPELVLAEEFTDQFKRVDAGRSFARHPMAEI